MIAAILLSGGKGDKKHAAPGTGTIVNTKPGTVLVPAVVGMTQAQATRRLQDLGLDVQAREQTSREAAGVVLAQTPKPGTRLPRGAAGRHRRLERPAGGRGAERGRDDGRGRGREAPGRGAPRDDEEGVLAKPAGTVVAEKPPAGSQLTRGASVALTVSKGPARVTVPDVTGLAARTGRAEGPRGGSDPERGRRPVDEDRRHGRQPVAERRLERRRGARASGSTSRRARRDARRREDEAEAGAGDGAERRRQAAGRRRSGRSRGPACGRASRTSPRSSPEGTVIAQSPRAGTTAKRSSRVALKVSTGPSAPQQAAVPDVVGEDEATARSDLESAGFQVQVVEQETADPSQDGIVIDQDPAGGTQAPQGATVTIVVGRSPG